MTLCLWWSLAQSERDLETFAGGGQSGTRYSGRSKRHAATL
ncbi:hypothetical protein BF49_5958 [Bradyrhizobium sp.]|nr:hypothetical protein BF49_5958 [Bradyrhizobium sp.]